MVSSPEAVRPPLFLVPVIPPFNQGLNVTQGFNLKIMAAVSSVLLLLLFLYRVTYFMYGYGISTALTLLFHQLDYLQQTSVKFETKYKKRLRNNVFEGIVCEINSIFTSCVEIVICIFQILVHPGPSWTVPRVHIALSASTRTRPARHFAIRVPQDIGQKLLEPQISVSVMVIDKIGIYINGLAQDCSNSSALAMELLQFFANPSISGESKWYLFRIYRYNQI